MIIKSALVTQASGSIGGMTAAHSRGALYLRSRGGMTNPNSPAQQSVRTILANLQIAWQVNVTPAQRSAWETYGQNVPTTNRLGSVQFLTAHQWYIACNVTRMRGGLARIDAAPTVFSLANLSAVTITVAAAGTDVSVAFNPNDAWANEVGGALIVQVARQRMITKIYFKGPFRFAASILGAIMPPASPQAVAGPYAETYTAGRVVSARVRAVRADGRISSTQFIQATVA